MQQGKKHTTPVAFKVLFWMTVGGFTWFIVSSTMDLARHVAGLDAGTQELQRAVDSLSDEAGR